MQWAWIWASFERWWRTGIPVTLQCMGSQRRTQLSTEHHHFSWIPSTRFIHECVPQTCKMVTPSHPGTLGQNQELWGPGCDDAWARWPRGCGPGLSERTGGTVVCTLMNFRILTSAPSIKIEYGLCKTCQEFSLSILVLWKPEFDIPSY